MENSEVNDVIYDHRGLKDWSKLSINQTNNEFDINNQLPIDMRFNDGHKLSITVYSMLLIISSIGNVRFLKLLIMRRLKTPSKIDIMLMHLAIADLLVTFLLMPLEIFWAVTVTWTAGDCMCRLMMFFRTFGLYLSSFVLVCISVDRYFAVLRPLHMSIKRSRIMLMIAWLCGAFCSIPQAVIFHLENHPEIKWYKQCVTFHFFENSYHEMVYQIINMCLMYIFPLIVIIFCYASIYIEIYRKTKIPSSGVDRFRRSNDDILSRAKRRTLRLTVTIVIVFLVCWTPYYIMCTWYWLYPASAINVDQRIQKILFLFACTNSCMNPLVYGIFHRSSKCANRRDATKMEFKQKFDQMKNGGETEISENVI